MEAERIQAPHNHPCPECGKLFLCDKTTDKCDAYVAKLLDQFPCEGKLRKQYEAPVGVCVHCGVEGEPMEFMSSGDESNCCQSCWKEIKEAERAEIPEREAAWRVAIQREELEGQRRARTKAQKKHDDLEERGQMVIEATKPGLRLVT